MDPPRMLNRRRFLQGLVATAAGLYVPTKTIFLPPSGGWPVSDVVDVYVSDFGVHRVSMAAPGTKEVAMRLMDERQIADAIRRLWEAGGQPGDIIVALDKLTVTDLRDRSIVDSIGDIPLGLQARVAPVS